jgi:RNA polymerase sigma factor (sigma-70 family)
LIGGAAGLRKAFRGGTSGSVAGFRGVMAASYEADPEVRLMSRVAKGDAKAFDALVRRVTDPLVAFLSKRTRDPDIAADLAQETLLRAFRGRKDYRPDARFRTWLFRIAMNVDLNRRRYDGYRAAASLDDASEADGAPLSARTPDAKAEAPTSGAPSASDASSSDAAAR